MELLRWAKGKGWAVSAEVTPHHLSLTDDLAESYDPVFKVNPPLRTAADVAALRAGLADGTIDCVATDHAPHAIEDKETEWGAALPGMLGLQTALAIVIETMVEPGLLDWRGVADRMSVAPARIGALAEHGRPDRGWRAGEPGRLSTRRQVDRLAGRAGVEVPQHAVRRTHGPRPCGRHRIARPADVSRRRRAGCGTGVIRLLLVLVCLAVLVAALCGMWVGWRHRAARQHGLGSLPEPPVELGRPIIEGESGLYIGTTSARSWQDRIVVQGLGRRSAATATLFGPDW